MAKLIHNHQVKILPCSPTFLNMMYLDGVFEEFDFKSLRLVTYGTERMPEELLTRLSKELPRVKFLQTFVAVTAARANDQLRVATEHSATHATTYPLA